MAAKATSTIYVVIEAPRREVSVRKESNLEIEIDPFWARKLILLRHLSHKKNPL
jgi:hypothetical protein